MISLTHWPHRVWPVLISTTRLCWLLLCWLLVSRMSGMMRTLPGSEWPQDTSPGSLETIRGHQIPAASWNQIYRHHSITITLVSCHCGHVTSAISVTCLASLMAWTLSALLSGSRSRDRTIRWWRLTWVTALASSRLLTRYLWTNQRSVLLVSANQRPALPDHLEAGDPEILGARGQWQPQTHHHLPQPQSELSVSNRQHICVKMEKKLNIYCDLTSRPLRPLTESAGAAWPWPPCSQASCRQPPCLQPEPMRGQHNKCQPIRSHQHTWLSSSGLQVTLRTSRRFSPKVFCLSKTILSSWPAKYIC